MWICKRCIGHKADKKKAADRWLPKAKTWIRSHREKFTKAGFVAEPPEGMTARASGRAYREFMARRYKITPEGMAQFMKAGYAAGEGRCQIRCNKKFKEIGLDENGRNAGIQELEVDWRDRTRPPDFPHAFQVGCRTCNSQKGTTEEGRWHEDAYWDELWAEAVARNEKLEPKQISIFDIIDDKGPPS